LKEGKVVQLQNAFTTVYREKVQLNLGNMGSFVETDDEGFVKAEEIPEDMPQASGDFRPQRRRRDFRGRDDSYRGRPKW
jgi:replication factor A1